MSMAELQTATQKLSTQDLHQFARWVAQFDDAKSKKEFFALPQADKYLRLQQAAEEAARDGLYAAHLPLREWLDEYIDDPILEA